MSMFVRGAKNAFRSGIRTESIVVILAISIGLGLSMLLANVAVSQRISDLKAQVGTAATVRPAGSFGDQGGGEPLTSADVAKIKNVPHVASAESVVNVMLQTEGNDQGGFFHADAGGAAPGKTNLVSPIDPGTLGKRFNTNGGIAPPANFSLPIRGVGTDGIYDESGATYKIISGRELQASDTNSALIGKDLATKNSLQVGGTFSAYGETFTVVGIFDAGTTFANAGVALPLATAQRLTSQTDQVSLVLAQADSIDNVQAMVDGIKNALGTSKADVTIAETNVQAAIDGLQSVQRISIIGFVMAIVAASVVIFLTMLMIVRERRREIGVLKAIGGSNRSVVGQFVVEALVLVVLGAVVGLGFSIVASNGIVSALVSGSTNSSESQVNKSPSGARVFRIGGNDQKSVTSLVSGVAATIGWTTLVYAFAASLLIALVGSAIPAWLITKVRPAEVLRGE